MLRQFPFHPPQYIGSLAASSHVSSLAPTLIPLYKSTPLDYLNYPLRYEALFLFLSWQMQRVNKTPSNPLWNCHQFTLSFIKLQNFVFEWRPQLVYHFQNVSRNSVGKVNGNSCPPVSNLLLNQVSGFCGHYSDTLNGTTSTGKRDSQTRFTSFLFPSKSSAVPVFTFSAC